MGSEGSKTQAKSENAPGSNVNTAPASCEADFTFIEDSDVISASEAVSSQNPSKPASQQLSFAATFKSFIETSINDSDLSTESITDHAKALIPDGFTNISTRKLNRCFSCTVESLYKHFDKLRLHRDIVSMIFEDARQSSQSASVFSTALGQLCRSEINTILSNTKWSEIVMFGALLCELAAVHHEGSTVFTIELNLWIQEILKSALYGNQNGLIAYMLILNRLISNKDVFERINRRYFKILRTLLEEGDFTSKLQTIESCLNASVYCTNNDVIPTAVGRKYRLKLQKCMRTDDSEYLEEVGNSQKCKDFDAYLNSKSKGINDCCDFFSDATSNEVEYFSRKLIDHAIEHPKEIKILGSIASMYQSALLKIRRLIKDAVTSLEDEFVALKQAGNADSFEVGNLGRLLGELYVTDKQIIPPDFMTSFLTFLTDNGDITTIASTLKLCGYFYKSKNEKNFENFMDSINVFRPIVEDEFAHLSESYENKEQIYEARLFKPEGSARELGRLEIMINSIAENKSVRFNYELSGILHMNYKRVIKLVIKSLQKPDANAVELAKFLKSLHDFTFKIGNFVKKLKANLEMRVLDMSTDNLQEMKSLGMFIAELKNLLVISNESQKLWLEKAKSLDPVENFEVMDVYVDVVKAMLVNIQIYDFEKLKKIHQYLLDINRSLETNYTETACRIKSKLLQIFENIVLKKVDIPTTEVLFKIRLGQRIEGLPTAMPENDPIYLDVQDFAKIFYINAISNHLYTAHYATSIRSLRSEPKGEKFVESLRDMLCYNLHTSIHSPDFCESDEAQGTFELFFQLFKEEVLSGSKVAGFLQLIYTFKHLEKYKELATRFTEDLHSLLERGTGRNGKKFNQCLRKFNEKVRQKLKELDVGEAIRNAEGTENEKSDLKQDERFKGAALDGQLDLALVPGSSKDEATIEPSSCKALAGEPLCQSTASTDHSAQSSWEEIRNLLKKDQELDIGLSSILLDQEQHPPTWGMSMNTNFDEMAKESDEGIEPAVLTDTNDRNSASSSFQDLTHIDKQAQTSKSSTPIRQFPSIHSDNFNIPGLAESYNEILPVITTNTSHMRRHAMAIYNWSIEDQNLKPQVKELTALLSTELGKHHKQLLNDVTRELMDELDIIRRAQGVKNHAGKKFFEQRNSFILTSRAVFPFLEKRHIYDILYCMMIHIRDGNRIVLELFLDIVEGMDDVFSVDCKARTKFIGFSVQVLGNAVNFKNSDPRTSKWLKYFTTLKNKIEKTPSISTQEISKSQIGHNYVSPWPDKPRRRPQGGRKPRDSSRSTQKSGLSRASSQSTGMSSQSVQSSRPSSWQSSQKFQSSGKSSQKVQSSGKTSQKVQSSGQASQKVQSSGQASQKVQSSQAIGKSSSTPSNVIKDPPATLKTDAKVMFYINQLQSTNIQQVGPKLIPILSTDFSRRRFMEILLQKGISDEKFINPAIDLFEYLFRNNNIGQAKVTLADEIGNEFINLCEDGGKLQQKMMNLVKFTLAFDPYLQGSFLYQLWKQLLEFVEQDCPNSLKALVLLMSNKFDILYETKERKRFIRYVLMVFRRKLGEIQDKGLRAKMKNFVKSIERGEAASNVTQRSDQRRSIPSSKPEVASSVAVKSPAMADITSISSKLMKNKAQELQGTNQAKLIEGLTKDVNSLSINRPSPAIEPAGTSKQQLKASEVPIKSIQPKFQVLSNEKLIKTHPDDLVRPLNFTPDYFLFDDLVTNPQKFEKILKILCEKCTELPVKFHQEQNSIKIKENIAVAIIKVNFLKTQVKIEEFGKFADVFYELYTRTDQTKFIQWILMKLLKALNLNDQKVTDKPTKIYDRYSKSVLRVKKSFKISEETVLKHPESLPAFQTTVQKTQLIPSTLGVLTSKSKKPTSKSRTITLVFDDLVPKAEKRSNSVVSKRADDVSLNTDKTTSNSSDITSKQKDPTEGASQADDPSLKMGDLTSKSGGTASNYLQTSSKPNISQNTATITSKSAQNSFYTNFMTNLQNLIFDQLTSTAVDADRDPFCDYFQLKKKKAYEMVCDLYFLGLISTQFVVSCIARMFEHPLIIDKNADVVVRLMKLVDKFVRIRNKEKNFLEVLQLFWLRLPFGVELMFLISVDKWTVLKNFIQKALLCRSNAVEFRALIESLWTELTEKPERFADVVRIFEDFLEVLGDSFAVLIVNFMENRRMSLDKFPTKNISKVISLKFKTSILFAFELFEMAVLNCEMLSRWLSDNVYGKLMQEHKDEILVEFGQKGLKVDANLEDNLMIYSRKLNNLG